MQKRVVILGGGAAIFFVAFIVIFAVLGKYKNEEITQPESALIVYPIEVISYKVKGDSLTYSLNNPHKELDLYLSAYFTVKGRARELNYEGHFDRHIPNGLSNITVDLSQFDFNWPDDGLSFSKRKDEIHWMHMDIISNQFPGLLMNVTNFLDGVIINSTNHKVIPTPRDYFDIVNKNEIE